MDQPLSHGVFVTGAGAFLPNDPVSNDCIEQYIGPDGRGGRLRKRILKSNGIISRHYALDRTGATTHLNEELAAHAIRAALAKRGLQLDNVEMLAVGSTQGDLPVPGFASMVHGRLGGPPLEILSAGGVCCAGMAALRGAYLAIKSGERSTAVACGSELPSRILKASRFTGDGSAQRGPDDGEGQADFDANFLRWMLSDGAGALVLESAPKPSGVSLRVDWIELTSFANEHPVCMYFGVGPDASPKPGNTWFDYPQFIDAERAGTLRLRQDTRRLPQMLQLCVEQYLRLVRRGRIDPATIDHFLCHYSSHMFREQIVQLLTEAGVLIPEERWFTNLYTKGNTGAASIYIMLEECLAMDRFKPGQQILLAVPESGRFSVAIAKLTAVAAESNRDPQTDGLPVARDRYRAPTTLADRGAMDRTPASIAQAMTQSPLGGVDESANDVLRYLVIELALVWADLDRMLRTVPIVRRIDDGVATVDDYKRLLCNLRQQVMEGGRWIARAASNVSIDLFSLRSTFIEHAGEEHRDYQMLERDFVAVGGTLEEITSTPKNIGSEALSSFMFHHASQPDPLDLLGAMFVIEGLGMQRARQWGERLTDQLGLRNDQVTFLLYHGANDENHFDKLKEVFASGIIDRNVAQSIVKTAKVTARLYALQLEEIDHT